MSAALSGGQEITSAFSRSLYYATSPGTPALPRTYIHVYTHSQIHTDRYHIQTDTTHIHIHTQNTHAHTKLLRIVTLCRGLCMCVYACMYMCGCTTHPVSGRSGLIRGYLPTYLPEPEIHMYTNGVCTAVWQRYLGLTIMRLVANGTDTRIPADVTTCKMAAAHDAASRSREIDAWT